jgi:hypothetical protein
MSMPHVIFMVASSSTSTGDGFLDSVASKFKRHCDLERRRRQLSLDVPDNVLLSRSGQARSWTGRSSPCTG